MTDQLELTRSRQAAAVLQTVNPATGEPGRSYNPHSIDDARAAAAAAHQAFQSWRRTAFDERATVIRKAGEILRAREDEFARLMTEEMGKTLDDGRAEIEKCAANCDWFADHAHEYLADQPADIGGGEAFVTFNPLGIVLAVMPWNFPFWQVFRFAAPALMAGNGAILKHASNVPGCALAIEQVLHDAGVPKDLFRTMLLPSSEVEALIKDEHIAAVTLTGSVAAGKAVATAAGSVLKKCVLELGGSDAYLVLEDADMEAAAKVAATARMVNGGQSCIAGKRFIVVRSVIEPFEQALVAGDARLSDGRPDASRAPGSGRCKASRRATKSTSQVEQSIANGARLLLGGEVPDRPGAWYPATVLADVRAGQPAHDEEVFGPVAAIIAADDEADAIRIANASEFGLGSGVLTADLDRGRRIAAEELEAGLRASSTRMSAPTRARRSAGSSIRATAANAGRSASASSPTSRRCTSSRWATAGPAASNRTTSAVASEAEESAKLCCVIGAYPGRRWTAHPIPAAGSRPRSNIFVMATLYAAGGSTPVRVRNMSRSGALVEASALPPAGTGVRLCRGSVSVAGEVMWVDEHKAGLRFASPTAAADWLPGGTAREGPAARRRGRASGPPWRGAGTGWRRRSGAPRPIFAKS